MKSQDVTQIGPNFYDARFCILLCLRERKREREKENRKGKRKKKTMRDTHSPPTHTHTQIHTHIETQREREIELAHIFSLRKLHIICVGENEETVIQLKIPLLNGQCSHDHIFRH